MKLLLDSHALLWFLADDPQWSGPAREAIGDGDNQCFVSAATLWEIAIKVSLGKLTLRKPIEQVFPAELVANRFELLPITAAHVVRLVGLPFHHRDPFDRLLVVQVEEEGLTLVTCDPVMRAYEVAICW